MRERERKKQNYKLWPLYIIYLCMYIVPQGLEECIFT